MYYKNHSLVISKRDSYENGWFTGTSYIGGKNWIHERFTKEELIELFKEDVDRELEKKIVVTPMTEKEWDDIWNKLQAKLNTEEGN